VTEGRSKLKSKVFSELAEITPVRILGFCLRRRLRDLMKMSAGAGIPDCCCFAGFFWRVEIIQTSEGLAEMTIVESSTG
jgi:hypothetical protein